MFYLLLVNWLWDILAPKIGNFHCFILNAKSNSQIKMHAHYNVANKHGKGSSYENEKLSHETKI